MNWQQLGAQLAQMGLPILGRIIGGQLVGHIPVLGPILGQHGAAIGENIGNQIAAAIAIAVGIPVSQATPDKIGQAIETQPTGEVMAKLKAVEAEVAARWPALADMHKADVAADAQVEVEIAKVNAETFNRARAVEEASNVAENDYWTTLYRPISLWGATFAFLYLIGLVLYAATVGGDVRVNVVAMESLLWSVFAALVGILFGHWLTRASERRRALDVLEPKQTGSTTTTVTTKG